jgi:hypothetical protein
LPDAPDLVKRTKKQREALQRYTPVPDSVIASARMDGQTVTYVDPSVGNQSTTFTSGGGNNSLASGMQSLTELGQARGQLLSLKLDKA